MHDWFLPPPAPARPPRLAARLRLEVLEARTLLTFTPLDIQHAYGLDQVVLTDGNGNPVPGDGTGETIALVEAYREPNIASDLAYFDNYFGIPDPPSFQEVYSNGTPQGNSNWGLETALDVEYSHAMAPGANIVVVEAPTQNAANLFAAEDVARNYPGVGVISNSWGFFDFGFHVNDNGHFLTPDGHNGVTFFAGSGDFGGIPIYPSTSPSVVAVGGTSLYLTDGEYDHEDGWNSSGGGQSGAEPEGDYQYAVQSSGMRQTPDVSMVADPTTGVMVYDTYGLFHGFVTTGGTSASSPMWAGLMAIADQGMNLLGYDTLDGVSQTLPGLYGLAVNNNYPYYDGTDFHDIQTGTAGQNQAGLGYDLVTGLGTPIANNLIPDLIAYETAGPGARVTHSRPRGAEDAMTGMVPAMPESGSQAALAAYPESARFRAPVSAIKPVSTTAEVHPAWTVADSPAVLHAPSLGFRTDGGQAVLPADALGLAS